jgi:opacity protein-like surface antigen
MLRHAAAVTAMLVLSAPVVQAQEVVFTVTAPTADVYQSPSMGGVVIGHAPRGKSFEVTRELGSWVRVAWPGVAGGAGYLHVTWGTLSRGGLPAVAVRSTFDSPSDSTSTLAPAVQRPGSRPLAPAAVPATVVSLPSHVVGLGGRMGSEAFGFAATGRAWSTRRLGLQVEVSRSSQSGLVAAERASTMQFAPSVIYSPRDVLSDAMWVRPYLGGGVNIARSSRDTLTTEESSVDRGLGFQMFGGAEFTWANVPQLAVSADLRRLWLPVPFSEAERAGRFGVSMSIHWYLR